jgi:capsular polysaccharide transport system permease protein
MPEAEQSGPGITSASSLADVRQALSTPEQAGALSVHDLLAASEIAHREGYDQLAVDAMGFLLEREPGEPRWHHRMAQLLILTDNRAAAEGHCETAVSLSPNFEDAYRLLSHICADREDFESALAACHAQERSCGESAGLTFDIAHFLFKLDRLAEALVAIQRVNDSGAPTEASLLLEAEIAYRRRNLRVAANAVERASRLWPESPAVCAKLAALLCELGEYEGAIPILARAREFTPASAPLAHLHAVALMAVGSLRPALEAIRQALQLNPAECEYHYVASVLSERLGERDQAIAYIQDAMALAPDRTALYVNHANMLGNAGDFDGAVAALDRARSLAPGDPEIRHLSLAYLAQQDNYVAERGNNLPRKRLSMPRAPGRRLGRRDTETFPGRLAVQLRVLVALVLRELRYRAVHSRFGVLSVMVPQAIQIVTLGIVLSLFNNGRPPIGDHLFFFYATGVMPFYMFIHVMDHSQNQFLDNLGLLQIPLVTRLDVVLGMAIAELLINAATIVATFGTFALISYGPSSDNHIEAVYAMLAVWLFAFGLGLISAVVNNLYRPWANGWLILQRFLYIASGVFYIPQSMPDWIREILVWNPILQAIEWFRTGFFSGYDPPWLDKPYLLGVAFATAIVGMMLERTMRRKMKSQ